MAFDEELADRVRGAVRLAAAGSGITERRMFGGLAFLVGGHMAVAVSGRGGLMVRVDPTDAPRLLGRRGVRRMEMGGRELDGWLLVDATALGTERRLADWVGIGVAFAGSLPPKAPAARR